MKKLTFLIVSILFFANCRKKEKVPAPDDNTTNDVVNGTIKGSVTQFDQFGIQLTSGLNSVTVSIEGKNVSGVTDVNGNYTLSNVPPGTYNISFNRTGAALWQKQQVSFAGNGTYYLNGYSTEKPTYSFSGVIKDSIAPPINSHRIFAILSMSPLSNIGGLLVIRGKTANLDITNPSSYENIYQNSVPANVSSHTLWFDYGYSGTWYYRAYPFPNIYNGAFYDDVASEKRIYSAYGNPLPGVFAITIP